MEATVSDLMKIADFLEELHPDSAFSDIPFCRRSSIKTTGQCMTGDGKVWISTKDGFVTGVLAATLEPVFFNHSAKWATDVYFTATGEGAKLLKRFVAWAKEQEVDRIIMGVSTNDPKAGALYKSLGFKRIGGMYELCS